MLRILSLLLLHTAVLPTAVWAAPPVPRVRWVDDTGTPRVVALREYIADTGTFVELRDGQGAALRVPGAMLLELVPFRLDRPAERRLHEAFVALGAPLGESDAKALRVARETCTAVAASSTAESWVRAWAQVGCALAAERLGDKDAVALLDAELARVKSQWLRVRVQRARARALTVGDNARPAEKIGEEIRDRKACLRMTHLVLLDFVRHALRTPALPSSETLQLAEAVLVDPIRGLPQPVADTFSASAVLDLGIAKMRLQVAELKARGRKPMALLAPAARQVRRARFLLPETYCDSLRYLGDLQLACGQRAEARVTYRRSAAVAPDEARAAVALARQGLLR